jgi:hypothetical protein
MRPISYAVIGVSILAVIVIAAFAFQQSQPSQKPAKLPVATQPVFELGMYGQTLSHADAEAVLGYEIKLPTYLPANNELRMIKVDNDTNWSFVIYSPTNVDDSTREKEMIDNNGFIIVNAPAPEVTDVNMEIQRFVEFGGKEITMQNVKGVGFTDIPLMPGYSEIHWWDNGLHRIVGANFDFMELAKIIESI